MKLINKVLGSAMLLSIGMTSCIDGNDWETDSQYNRLFSPSSIKVEVTIGSDEVNVTFQKVKGAESYIIELSTDSTTAAKWTTTSEIASSSRTLQVTTSPATISELKFDTNYYLRLKAQSASANDSRWNIFDTGSKNYFTLKDKSIEAYTDNVTESSITVKWIGGSDVTYIVAKREEAVVDSVVISEDVKAAGEYVFTNLKSATSYSFILGNSVRVKGTTGATTLAPVAKGEYRVDYDGSANINDFLSEVAARAAEDGEETYKVYVNIASGLKINFAGVAEDGGDASAKAPAGMAVEFIGGAERPTLTFPKAFNLAGSHEFVKFTNLKLEGGEYFINQSASATVGEVTLTDCEISGFKTSFFRTQGSAVISLANIELNNCIAHDCCSGYSFLHLDNATCEIGNVTLKNSTFYNICNTNGKCFFYRKSVGMTGDLLMDHCTFYNVMSSTNFFIDFGDASLGANSESLTHCLFGSTGNMAKGEQTTKGVRSKNVNNYDCTGSMATQDWWMAKNKVPAIEAVYSEYTSAQVFKNPAEGDFTLLISQKVGDPRWYNE